MTATICCAACRRSRARSCCSGIRMARIIKTFLRSSPPRTAAWAKENGIDFRPFRFHDLRHYHAVTWLKDGRSIYDLQARLGHRSIKTTEDYLRYLTPDEERV